MIDRRDIHELIDRQLDEWKYAERVPIQNGRLTFELQIENGQIAMVTKERERKQLPKQR